MLSLSYLNFGTIILDTSAILIVIGILRETRFMRRTGMTVDRLFFRMLVVTVVMALSDMGAYITVNRADPLLTKIQILSMSVFYIAFTVLSMFWFDYCNFKFKCEQKEAETGFRPVFIPGVITIALITMNIFTGIIFSVDDIGAYHRNFLFIPMYIVLILYIGAGFVMIGNYRTIDKKRLIPLWLYVMPLLVSIIITFVVGEVSMAALGAAISIAFTHLGTMSEVAEISIRETKKL